MDIDRIAEGRIVAQALEVENSPVVAQASAPPSHYRAFVEVDTDSDRRPLCCLA